MTFNKETIKRRSALFIFWAWHVTYTIIALFLVLPEVFLPLVQGGINDTTPWHYVAYPALIALLPFISIYLAIKYFQKDYRLLMKYFYGFEMPLLFFLVVRIFTFRDDGLAVNLLMLNVALGLAAWLVFLFVQQRQGTEDNLPNHWWAVIGSTVLAGVGLYFGSIFLIIQIPNIAEFLMALGDAITSINWDNITNLLLIFINPLWWLFGVFIFFTLTLFLVLPLAMIYLYIGQFLKRLPNFKTSSQWALILIILLVNIGIFNSATEQPQQQVFEMLETDEPKNQAELIEQSDTIRQGLLNAYLARYRYISTNYLSQRIHHNYQDTFGLSSSAADIPQKTLNTLLKPFLYDGKSWNDQRRAARHYATFFDAPIQKAERDLIVGTIKHTWEITRSNEAGLLDAANHYVHLDEQSIDVTELNNVATITVQQTLRNLTSRARETVLHFSLPEDAVLTGVWLSDRKDKPLKYPYALAPKGAAQAVYKAEVNRRVDPALLEQTGPYQYRLRVYPVPGKPRNKPGEPLYARFSYQTLADQQGNWPMPQILEKRNLFWDDDTHYFVNGKAHAHYETRDSFPIKLSKSHTDSKVSERTFQTSDQQIQAILRQPGQEILPTSEHFAVIIDGSYSMRDQYDSVLKTLVELKENGIQFDRYFCKETCQPFRASSEIKPLFFGNSQTLEHLQAFGKNDAEKQYDAVLVLSDAGSYELAKETDKPLSLSQPLWLVHMDDLLPYAYDDKILDTIYRSKGGIANSALEALRRYQLLGRGELPAKMIAPSDAKLISVSEQYLWFAKPNVTTPIPETTESIVISVDPDKTTGIAAAHWLRYLIRQSDTRQLDTLDRIHAIAKRFDIVTHYSSMLVLVNDRQKEALKKAEEGDDRFDREVEKGKQQSSTPSDPFAVPAVPEPEEWALIIIVMMLLSYTLWRRRQGLSVI